MKEINQTHELIIQLQVLLRPFIPASLADTAGDLFKQALRCSNSAISMLQAGGGSGCESSDLGSVHSRETIELEKKRKCSESRADKIDSRKRRKNQGSWSVTTTVPYEDGYQWRKYGQKLITGDKHPRNYFRCTYSKEQGCPAAKTVQQDNCETNPAKYNVVYSKEHTCKATKSSSSPFVLECTTATTTTTSTTTLNELSSMFNEYYEDIDYNIVSSTTSIVTTSRDGSLSPVSEHCTDLASDKLMSELNCSSPTTVDMLSAHYDNWDWASMIDNLADFSHDNHF